MRPLNCALKIRCDHQTSCPEGKEIGRVAKIARCFFEQLYTAVIAIEEVYSHVLAGAGNDLICELKAMVNWPVAERLAK